MPADLQVVGGWGINSHAQWNMQRQNGVPLRLLALKWQLMGRLITSQRRGKLSKEGQDSDGDGSVEKKDHFSPSVQ